MRELALLAAYLLGSIPFAYLAVRLVGRGDVRTIGSGNVGATNTLRAAGWKVALVVALLDVGKGVAAVLLMRQTTASPDWAAAAAVAAVVGHCFPVWLGFSGGKGVATALGGLVVLAPAACAAVAMVWVVVLAVWRYVSLASVCAAAAFPVALQVVGEPTRGELGAAVITALVIIGRHHGNIRRLVRREEPRVWGRKR
ncbi:MAG: glycerol-3-phosphate 1-O-acyltransferase PlsY [Acidobacteriota bacterium]